MRVQGEGYSLEGRKVNPENQKERTKKKFHFKHKFEDREKKVEAAYSGRYFCVVRGKVIVEESSLGI